MACAIRRSGELEDGQEVDRISSWLMPNVIDVPDIGMKSGQSSGISWVVPVDDSHYVQAFVMKVPGSSRPGNALRWQALG